MQLLTTQEYTTITMIKLRHLTQACVIGPSIVYTRKIG